MPITLKRSPPTVAVYSISDLEKLTGIKAATLRAWEQRYGIVTPKRTETNIRYYLDADLRKLLNVALLNKNGVKISKIAKMSGEERTEKVASLSPISVSSNAELDTMTLATVEMDEFKIGHILDTNIKQRGIEATMLEVVYPFLEKLGVLYFTGSVTPVQESFIASIIRQKIIAAIDKITPPRRKRGPVFALYLPDGERQELSLLFMNYLLRKRNFRTIYLGGNISISDLNDFYRHQQPDYLFTIISNAFIYEPVEQHVTNVLEACPESTLLLTGYQASMHDFTDIGRLRVMQGLEATLDFVDGLAHAAVHA
ncbi:MerR family transcriptional regulator [Neolewinella antarctica]|uniref:DNA-binding transcriptional MerR regulator n=1 Tax=Neolewinella antarctica TaxID=442734 RepID=A0ABX0XEI7_9BACT|nr:MerR family transcriptional regulator [Neolewinella antarctica]NJC27731.1 DNA-binding transcriptional MerR regulator [Neolewinella antarctica]